MEPTSEPGHAATDLLARGFVHLRTPPRYRESAWSCASAIFREVARSDRIGANMPALQVVGEFALPPHGAVRREFQVLHIDFGLPLAGDARTAVARYTALHIDPDRSPTTALTRVVPLAGLLGQRSWGDHKLLAARLRSYAFAAAGGDAASGYVEGILGRLIEAADGTPALPLPVGGHLCGTEFASLSEERDHLAERGLDLDRVEHRIRLGPGELLLLDNLATAHGRLGIRDPLELNQLCVGYPGLDAGRQAILLDRVLQAFRGGLPA
jgi:hypothetical protein